MPPAPDLLRQAEARAAAGDERARRVLPRMREAAGLDPATGTPRRMTARRRPNPVVRKLRALNRFLDYSARALTPAAAVVWLLLRDERGGRARSAVSDLARRAAVSPRTVKRALAALKAGGFLAVVRRGGPLRDPSVYRLRPLGHAVKRPGPRG